MTEDRRRSPLHHRTALGGSGGINVIEERKFVGLIQLRGEPGIIGSAVADAVGAALPASVGETTVAGSNRTMWLAPDEWVIRTAPGNEAALLEALNAGLAGVHHQTVDVTDYYTVIHTSGPQTRNLLAKLSHFDLHPRAFPSGMAVATTMAKAGVWLDCIGHNEEVTDFDIVIRRSMADYLWCLLAEAGREWGVPTQTPIGLVKLHAPHLERA